MLKRFYIFNDIEDIFKKIFDTNDMTKDLVYNGFVIKRTSLRYELFKKSRKCVSCGIEGSFFALEQNLGIKEAPTNRCHFNLYAIDKKGKEVLMTKDHIKPRSKGGTDVIKNLQTMCTVCNEKKGNKY